MTAFYSIAALLAAAAAAMLIVPLWFHMRRSGKWSTVGLAAAFAIVPLAFALYVQITNWDPSIAHRADEETQLVAKLADRLRQTPDDVEGWRLLARSYVALGQYAEGREAYRQAWERTPTPDNELKLEYAESQVLMDRAALTGDAGQLFEQVAVAEPDNTKALWYAGLVALEVGREDLLKARWSHALELGLPEQVAQIVRAKLTELGAAPSGEQAGAGATAVASGPTITLSLTLGSGHSVADLGPTAALFILARAPGGGPPVAVIRQPASAVPGQFTLSDRNSMIPGRSLADFDELTLVARLSRSGQPTAQPGDVFAETAFKPKDGDAAVALVLDQVVQ